ncbi:MAG: response regulator transcription factor [Actinomycetota bacterium]
MPHRIFLVEDHASFRQTMALVFDMEKDFETVGQAGSVAAAREALAALDGGADVAIVDLTLPDGEGIELIEDLRAANPHCATLLLTASVERSDHARAVEAGAAGILHKSADVEEILEAVRVLAEGRTLLSSEEIIELLRLAGRDRERDREARANIERLTAREREVLQALAEGLSNKEIARKLHVSVDTERTHMMNILNKLGVHSRLQALLFAARHGLVKLR